MMLDPEILLWKDFDRGRMVARFWQNGGTVSAEWWRKIGRGMTMTWQNGYVILIT